MTGKNSELEPHIAHAVGTMNRLVQGKRYRLERQRNILIGILDKKIATSLSCDAHEHED